MSKLSEAAIVTLALVSFILLSFLVLVGFSAYTDQIRAYNLAGDRDLFQESYRIALECRRSYGVNSSSADKMCGAVPVFSSTNPL